MGFRHPEAFYLAIPLIVIVALHLWLRWKRRRDLRAMGDWRVLKNLVSTDALKRRAQNEVLALLGLAMIAFAATGPQFGRVMKEITHRGVDVFIIMDTSRSMLAEDVLPSRLVRAKRSLGLLIDKLEGNRVGIIAFAKFAVVQCPLTVDTNAARMFLEILDTNTVPEQGTSIGDAIRLALKSFNKEEKTGKAIVLLTDGEDHRSDPEGAARLAREQGVVVFTVGIGTAKGEVIKKRDERGNVTEFLKHKGEMVLSRLDEGLLSKISTLTGGHYFRASSSDREIDEIAEIINGFAKKEFGSRVFENRQERYQWFLLLGLTLLMFQFFRNENPGQSRRIFDFLNSDPFRNVKWIKRKGRTSALILLLLVFLSAPAWSALKDNLRRGTDLIKQKDWAGARGAFESALIDAPESAEIHFNIGNTYYFEGNFEEAKRSYEQALLMANDPLVKSRISYNMGHLIFHMGDRDGAIERFKETLRHHHRDEDAKYNIEYIRAGLTPKNPPQPQDQNEPSDSQDQPSPAEGSAEERKGEISKEQAEQILQMMQDQEKDQMRDAKDMIRSRQSGDQKDSESHEDW